tara:strand:+ start:652 stop:789 length:138 start_codon:yes stop_codon:yes gene_type:complete
MGNNIPAATEGFIVKDIIGTAKIEAGPAKPPFEIPKIITPKEAVK